MVFGFDVSTSVIGVALFQNDGTFVRVDHLDLTDIEGTDYEAVFLKLAQADLFAAELARERSIDREETNFVFVEDRLASFSAGRTMLQTLMKLASFNLAFSWIVTQRFWVECHAHVAGGTRVHHIHPSTVKAIMRREGLVVPRGSKDKKRLTLDFVAKREPTFVVDRTRTGTPKPYCFDRADAYVTALAGIRKYVQKIG